MPLYEYECDTCGHRFEKIQKFSDPLETTCPTCGGPVHKLMSSPAIQFKGSGFYITDYPKGDKGSAPKSDGGKKAGPKRPARRRRRRKVTRAAPRAARTPRARRAPPPRRARPAA